MAPDKSIPPVSSAGKKAKLLKLVAVLFVLLGIAGGSATFWGSKASGGLPDDVYGVDDSKVVQRNIAMNSGKMGVFASDLVTSWQDPGTRAAVILITASLIAGGCYYCARLLDRDDDEVEPGEVGEG